MPRTRPWSPGGPRCGAHCRRWRHALTRVPLQRQPVRSVHHSLLPRREVPCGRLWGRLDPGTCPRGRGVAEDRDHLSRTSPDPSPPPPGLQHQDRPALLQLERRPVHLPALHRRPLAPANGQVQDEERPPLRQCVVLPAAPTRGGIVFPSLAVSFARSVAAVTRRRARRRLGRHAAALARHLRQVLALDRGGGQPAVLCRLPRGRRAVRDRGQGQGHPHLRRGHQDVHRPAQRRVRGAASIPRAVCPFLTRAHHPLCPHLSLGSSTPGHSNRVFSLKFNPDDPNIIVSGGWDNTVQVRTALEGGQRHRRHPDVMASLTLPCLCRASLLPLRSGTCAWSTQSGTSTGPTSAATPWTCRAGKCSRAAGGRRTSWRCAQLHAARGDRHHPPPCSCGPAP